MTNAAVWAIARHEWRRRWRSLVLLGLVVGVFGGLLVTGATLTRRTATAPDRLRATVAAGDAEVQVFGSSDLVSELAGLPSVDRSWPAQVSVARVDGPAVTYVGVMAGPPRPEGMLEPVLLSGRAADPDRANEVVLVEGPAREVGMRPGDRMRISLLTAEEVAQFDTGFGDPDGPTVDLTVTGIVRVPPGVLSSSPILATPAFAARYGDTAAGTYLHVDLGGGSLADLRAEVTELTRSIPPAAGAEEFPPVAVNDLGAGTAAARASGRVLVGGLTVAVAVSIAAGLLALAQAFARHHAASAADQEVESALGLTARERTIARIVPATVAAAIAGAVTAAISLVGAELHPPGAMGRLEPGPGWRPNVAFIAAGALGVVALVLVVAAATSWRAGTVRARSAGATRAGSPSLRLVPWPSGWALAGGTFAVSHGSRRTPVPVRASLVGAVVGVAGIVAGLTFGASLDRLVASPQRWGWSGDLLVVDATDEIIAELRADPRVGAVTDLRSADVQLDGATIAGHSFGSDDLGWTLLSGRPPADAREVVLGTRVADRLDAGTGDTVEVGSRRARVSGVGVGPAVAGEDLGESVLLTEAGLEAASAQQSFREAMVRAAPGVDAAALTADLASRHELEVREPPTAVRDLAELGALPEVLGGFLAALGAVALVHTLAVTTRRRSRDLAVLRALGSTPAQAAGALVAMALTTATVGVAIGAPLGWAVARLVWGEVAESVGVAGDVIVPTAVAAALVAAFGVAAILALVPARQAVRARPAELLRAE